METFPVSYLNSGELLTVGESFLPIIKPITSEIDTLTPKLYVVLDQDVRNLSAVLRVPQGSAYTVMMSNLDDNFDATFTTFRDFCIVMSKQTSNEVVSVNAARIVDVINSINSQMHREGYAQELAQSRVLIDRLDVDEYLQALTACNGMIWFNIFKQAREEMREGFDQKIKSESKEETLKLKPIKVAIRRHITALYSHFEILNELEPEVFGTFANRLEEVVKTIVPSVRARRTRTENIQQQAQPQEDDLSTDDLLSAGDILPATF